MVTGMFGTRKLYLAHGRLDTVRKGKPPKEVVLKLRMYLTLPVSSYRDALASVMFSTHKLAVERLRWVDHGRPAVARHCRLCRLCECAVKTQERALLQCDSYEYLDLMQGIHEWYSMVECLDKIVIGDVMPESSNNKQTTSHTK